MYKNLKLLNYIIYLMLLFYLIIDMLTGISLHSVGISFSIPYKLILIFLMLLVIGFCDQYYFLSIMALLTWLVISFCYMSFTNSSNTSLAVQTYIKYISVFVFYFYFNICERYEHRIKEYLNNVLLLNYLIFVINIGLGVLGFGYSTYKYGIGVKGFFYAGNEIFLILLAISALLLQNRNKKFVFFISILSLFLSVMIGTKTAMLALFFIICANIFDKMTKIKKTITIILLPVILMVFVLIFNKILSNFEIFEHIIYNIKRNKKLTGSIIAALFSGRLDFLQQNLNLLFSHDSMTGFFLGGNDYYGGKSVEIDFFDSLILCGLPITILILVFYTYLIYKAYKNKQFVLMVLDFMVLMISFMAGHIWSNLTGGVFLIIANLFFNLLTDLKPNIKIGKYLLSYRR